jgi:hypothetical protein
MIPHKFYKVLGISASIAGGIVVAGIIFTGYRN